MEPVYGFSNFPKIELHLHLDCSLSYRVVSQLNPSVTYQEYLDFFVAPAKCTDLADCLTRALKGIELIQTEEQIELVTRDLFQQLEADRVIYAEIRFAPLLHTEGGLSAEKVVAVVEGAARDAIRETGVEARLILCTVRHFSEEQSLQTVKLVKRFKGTLVAGFDIAGDEAGYPIDAHIPAFRYAYEMDIPCTAHAGEARGPKSVWETLKHFRPRRLGHGVRSVEDPNLIEHLRQTAVHLEVCPTCNVQTDMYPAYADHPIRVLYDAGLSLGINTDTRTMTPITLTEEYQKLNDTFGWGKDHFLQCNLNALNAAFIPAMVKQSLKDRMLVSNQSN